jgi:hypothetical protein
MLRNSGKMRLKVVSYRLIIGIYGQLLYVLHGSRVSFGRPSNGHMPTAILTHPADRLNVLCCLQQNRDKIVTCLNSNVMYDRVKVHYGPRACPQNVLVR